ncbi:MAG: ABC transporter permease [Planctomycetota bacterium]
MTTYIIRRLLLMIPTLIGITFLVFMIVAKAGGGIGASLAFSGGGGEAGQNRAIQEAYLEDRYGLDDPLLVQYLRWLGRISPLKFGVPDQRDPTGEIIRPEKTLDEPLLIGTLWGDPSALERVPEPDAAELPGVPDKVATTSPDFERVESERSIAIGQRNASYREAKNIYTNVRAEYIGAQTLLEQAIVAYAESNGVADATDSDGDLIPSRVRGFTVDGQTELGAAVLEAGATAVEVFNDAETARADVIAVFKAKPYEEAFWRIGTERFGLPLRLGNAIHLGPPDFGMSFARSRPVIDLLGEALKITLLLNAIAVPIIYFVAIPMGVLSALKRGSLFDFASGAFFIALWSVPVVLAGVLAIGFLANQQYLGAFPVSGLNETGHENMTFLPSVGSEGWLVDRIHHIVLPVLCLVYAGFAVLTKQTRSAMLDNFSADYVRTAKAKGVSQPDVVVKHVLRNSLLPLITLFARVFPTMLAGSVVVETIFTVPGMGELVIEAIRLRDRELLLANTLMIGSVNLLALLLADILYAVADPRISYK